MITERREIECIKGGASITSTPPSHAARWVVYAALALVAAPAEFLAERVAYFPRYL